MLICVKAIMSVPALLQGNFKFIRLLYACIFPKGIVRFDQVEPTHCNLQYDQTFVFSMYYQGLPQ